MSKQIGFDWRRVMGFACAGAVIAVGGAAADARAGGTDGWEGTQLTGWGNIDGGFPTPSPRVRSLAIGSNDRFGILARYDGIVMCWGYNGYGQCNVPAGLANVTAVAAGGDHNVALKGDGTVACWGSNNSGQCDVPAGLAPVTAVAAGQLHTVALKGDATVACWGYNGWYQCNVPAGLAPVTAVAAGSYHTVALKGDGTVACWGDNGNGQCNVPADLAPVTAVAAGSYHTVALKGDGTVACWGSNNSGQCNVPAELAPVTAVAAGQYHTVALKVDGTVKCWGDNSWGQCNVPANLTHVATVVAANVGTMAVETTNGPVRAIRPGTSDFAVYPSIYDACQIYALPSWRVECADVVHPGFSWLSGSNYRELAAVGNFVTTGPVIFSGSITVAGDMQIPSLLRAGQVTVAGTSNISGDVEAGVTSGGDIQVGGSLAAGSLASGGDVQLAGHAQGSVTAVGSIYIPEYLQGSAAAEGHVNVLGNANASTLSAGSYIHVGGNADSSTLNAEGTVTVVGSAGHAAFTSGFVSATQDGVAVGSVNGPGVRSSAHSSTRVHGPIDLRNTDYDLPADITSTHRLILDGGVYSSDPNGTQIFPDQTYAHFDTCTDPAYSAVSPCLEFGPNSVIDLPPGNKIISHGPTTTLVGGLATLRNGSSIETDADLAIGGSMRIPVGTAISLSVDRTHTADPALSIRGGGELVVEFGSSVQVAAPAKTAIAGALTVDQSALFSLLGGADTLRVDPHGDARCFGGTIRADQMILAGAPVGSPSSVPGGRLVGVNALVDVGTVRAQGGSVNLATSTLVGDLVTEAQAGGSATVSTIAASGQIFGNVDNGKGKLISIGNLVVVGDVTNGVGSQVLAQVGIIYITGSLHNNGSIYGNVITAPGYNGGGTGGTQVGDGIRVAGAVDVGPSGELRFIEDLWKFSVCGDVSLACTSDNVRFNGAKLSLDGCNGTVQTVEATSRDLGCVAGAFSGAETQVSLIGELEVASGATVQLVDNFNNAPGKTAEVVYARGLTVQPGATLITNGIKVVTRNALIQGTVDNMANICVVVDAPDPDVNGDGHVNAIDLAFILTYWGTSAPIADLNRDGFVGAPDMSIVLNGWTWNS